MTPKFVGEVLVPSKELSLLLIQIGMSYIDNYKIIYIISLPVTVDDDQWVRLQAFLNK